MNTETVSGKFLASTAAVNVECGFVPDYIEAFSALGGTEIKYEWFKVLYDYAIAALGKYGFVTSIAPAHVAAATNGFEPYDISVETVQLPAPDGHGFWKAASIADYNAATTYILPRTVARLGHAIRPTVHNGFVYEQASGAALAGAEPTWSKVLGAITTDTGGNTWITRTERIVRRGVKGFTVGATICTNGEYWVFKAEKHSRYTYMGDADAENPVTFGDHEH